MFGGNCVTTDEHDLERQYVGTKTGLQPRVTRYVVRVISREQIPTLLPV